MLEQQIDYVLRTVEERGVRLVRLWFTDVVGALKSFAISPVELENALRDGMTFDGSSIDGYSRIQEADVMAIPDPNTFEVLPWVDSKSGEARVFCDIAHLDGSPFEGDPRQADAAIAEEPAAREEPGPGFVDVAIKRHGAPQFGRTTRSPERKRRDRHGLNSW